jgi:hypothetical protein
LLVVINKSDNGVMDSWLCADVPGIIGENDVCDTNRGNGEWVMGKGTHEELPMPNAPCPLAYLLDTPHQAKAKG